MAVFQKITRVLGVGCRQNVQAGHILLVISKPGYLIKILRLNVFDPQWSHCVWGERVNFFNCQWCRYYDVNWMLTWAHIN